VGAVREGRARSAQARRGGLTGLGPRAGSSAVFRCKMRLRVVMSIGMRKALWVLAAAVWALLVDACLAQPTVTPRGCRATGILFGERRTLYDAMLKEVNKREELLGLRMVAAAATQVQCNVSGVLMYPLIESTDRSDSIGCFRSPVMVNNTLGEPTNLDTEFMDGFCLVKEITDDEWEVGVCLCNQPTPAPTLKPTISPPTSKPTVNPTMSPTPTDIPTTSPTLSPTAAPLRVVQVRNLTVDFQNNVPLILQQAPTLRPTKSPTLSPTRAPTNHPTVQPTKSPTVSPTLFPTTLEPTESPSAPPSLAPTRSPTLSCIVEGMKYVDGTELAVLFGNATAQECQTECEHAAECTHFSFRADRSECLLLNGATDMRSRSSWVLGPKSCRTIAPTQSPTFEAPSNSPNSEAPTTASPSAAPVGGSDLNNTERRNLRALQEDYSSPSEDVDTPNEFDSLPFEIMFRCYFAELLRRRLETDDSGRQRAYSRNLQLDDDDLIVNFMPQLDFSFSCIRQGTGICNVTFGLYDSTPFPTAFPTMTEIIPTISPSMSPFPNGTLLNMTMTPSMSPTSANVTLNATEAPTFTPTRAPTRKPTLENVDIFNLDEDLQEMIQGLFDGLGLLDVLYHYYTGRWRISRVNEMRATRENFVSEGISQKQFLESYSDEELALIESFTVGMCPTELIPIAEVLPTIMPSTSGDDDPDGGLSPGGIFGVVFAVSMCLCAPPVVLFWVLPTLKDKGETGAVGTSKNGSGGVSSGATLDSSSDFNQMFKELEIEQEQLQLGLVIGHGANGRIFKALYHGSEVAVKELFPSNFQSNESMQPGQLVVDPRDQIWREVRNLRHLRHPNVIQMYGCTQARSSDSHQWRFLVVMELACCSLRDLLQDSGFETELSFTLEEFDFGRKMQLTKEVCAGLAYIHECNMIHFDIKPENILLNSAGHAKICDLGIAKLHAGPNRTINVTLSAMGGTPPYMAPELLRGDMEFVGTPADVYAFAIVLWQIFHPEESPHPKHWTVAKLFHEVMMNNFRPEIDPSVPKEVAKIMRSCWDKDYASRPSLRDVIEDIDDIMGAKLGPMALMLAEGGGVSRPEDDLDELLTVGTKCKFWEHSKRRFIKGEICARKVKRETGRYAFDILLDLEDMVNKDPRIAGIMKEITVEYFNENDRQSHLMRRLVPSSFLMMDDHIEGAAGAPSEYVFGSVAKLAVVHFHLVLKTNSAMLATTAATLVNRESSPKPLLANMGLSLVFEDEIEAADAKSTSSDDESGSSIKLNEAKEDPAARDAPNLFESDKMSMVKYARLLSKPRNTLRANGSLCSVGLHLPTFTQVMLKQIRLEGHQAIDNAMREVSERWENILTREMIKFQGNAANARIAKRELGVCPSLLNFFGCFLDETEQAASIFMEYMDGGSLQDVLDASYVPNYLKLDRNLKSFRSTDSGRTPRDFFRPGRASDADSDDEALKIEDHQGEELRAEDDHMPDFVLGQSSITNERILRRIAKAVLTALVFLHEIGEKHGYIKPARVLLNSRGQVKLGGFGLQGLWSDNQLSFAYKAPEQLEGEEGTASSDIWSFMMTLLTTCLGHHPFSSLVKQGVKVEISADLLKVYGKHLPLKLPTVLKFPAPLHFESPYEVRCEFSELFSDFVSIGLQLKPAERQSAKMLLQHPWITSKQLPKLTSSMLHVAKNMEVEELELAGLLEKISAAVFQRVIGSLASRKYLCEHNSASTNRLVIPMSNIARLSEQLGVSREEVKSRFIYIADSAGIRVRRAMASASFGFDQNSLRKNDSDDEFGGDDDDEEEEFPPIPPRPSVDISAVQTPARSKYSSSTSRTAPGNESSTDDDESSLPPIPPRPKIV